MTCSGEIVINSNVFNIRGQRASYPAIWITKPRQRELDEKLRENIDGAKQKYHRVTYLHLVASPLVLHRRMASSPSVTSTSDGCSVILVSDVAAIATPAERGERSDTRPHVLLK